MTTNRYTLWSQLLGTGLRKLNEDIQLEYEQAGRIRVYSSNVIPGPLQTAAYARHVLNRFQQIHRLPVDDIEEAVTAGLSRTEILPESGHEYTILLEESVLHAGGFSEPVMIEQLVHLRELVKRLPADTIGVIAHDAEHRPWPQESFSVFSDQRAAVELVSRHAEFHDPVDVSLYAAAFDRFADAAVYRHEALTLVADALAVLDPAA